MGTWNTKPFGNDTASDWLWTLEEALDESVLQAALGADAEGEETIAAAAVIEASRRQPLGSLPPKAKAWVSERGFVPSDALVKQAIAVVEKIKDHSELRELWAESDSLKSWLKQMDSLLAGLREVQSLPPPIRKPKAPSTPRRLEKMIEMVNPDEESPLREKLRKKLEALTDLEASVTGTVLAKSPLTLLAKQGLLPEAKRLVERGAKINPDTRGQIKYTPLGAACGSGHAEMARWLLEQGAKIYPEQMAQAPAGGLKFETKTMAIPAALYAAIRSGSIATIKILVLHGVRLASEDSEEKFWHDTLLHKAVDANHPHIIEYLVKSGVNVDVRNSLGMTSLSWAANDAPFKEREKVIEMLLSLGADPNAKDDVGLTALDLALGYLSRGVSFPEKALELIKKHGGRLGKYASSVSETAQI